MDKTRKCHWCQFEGIYHLLTDEGAYICTTCYHAYKREGGRFGTGEPGADSRITEVLSGGGVGTPIPEAAGASVLQEVEEDVSGAAPVVGGPATPIL